MNIKKFEAFDSGDYDYPYGGHCFVFARPKQGWDNYGFITSSYPFKNDEFVPCMISGYDQGQSIWIIGNTHAHKLSNFDIIKESEKEIKDLISIYTATKNYNI